MEIIDAARAMVDKLRLIEKDGRCGSIFVFAANHGCVYSGPNYEQELKNLEASLNAFKTGEIYRITTDRKCEKCGFVMRDVSPEISCCGGCDRQ